MSNKFVMFSFGGICQQITLLQNAHVAGFKPLSNFLRIVRNTNYISETVEELILNLNRIEKVPKDVRNAVRKKLNDKFWKRIGLNK